MCIVKSWKNITCMILVVLLAVWMVGCGDNKANNADDKSEDTIRTSDVADKNNEKTDEDNSKNEGPEPNIMPIANGDIELEIYMPFNDGARQVYETYADHPVVKKVEDVTGLKLKFIHPPAGDDGTFFNTLIASGEYPDLFRVTDGFKSYPGGPIGAIKDGILINMNDLIYKYAPNYLAMLEEKGDKVKKDVRADDGTIIYFGTVMLPPYMEGKIGGCGILCRNDWLKKLDMDPPITIDEYTNVLKAFRDELNVEVPLALPKAEDGRWRSNNVFASAFGVAHDGFYLDNGEVKYSRIQPQYKEYLKLLNMYYSEKLLDNDFANKTANDQAKLMSNGTAGIVIHGIWQVGKIRHLDQLIKVK